MATSKSLAVFWFLFLAVFREAALKADARAFFVFGDSLVDNGNNNFLTTTARADNVPYGIDYPTKRPTGRFSNGLNIPDLISEAIGSEATLPYLSPNLTGDKLLVGANFASAGVGILNDTGNQFFNIIRIGAQMQYLEQYKQRVRFVTSKYACCGQGPYNGIGLCTPRSNLCPNRDIYAFWDPFHPSERANRFIVKNILAGSADYISPMNLSTIMVLDAAENV
ncbi:SGNH hydrolase-type esterase domain-containing protein [Artemisia annua]|uniref:SGNH hydrolase-type esterase domain-containing protein n=1 Tax=Artemisia annua TaxID=35608 RepID=A0A2U1PNW3_ARTAN|nr:SGNH hydrolase-type esterase domain-containing protein [Artemisia annua]